MKIFSASIIFCRRQKETIPSLNKYVDNYIRSGYFGGATDHYKQYGGRSAPQKFSCVYFSEQLKSAISYGYKVEVINGHEFSAWLAEREPPASS